MWLNIYLASISIYSFFYNYFFLQYRDIDIRYHDIWSSIHRYISLSTFSPISATLESSSALACQISFNSFFLQMECPRVGVGLCTELNRAGILQSGRVIYLFFCAPTGHGLSFFCPVPRSGFVRGKKNANPITKPIINPISNPITAINRTNIHVENSKFTFYTILPFILTLCRVPTLIVFFSASTLTQILIFFTSHHHRGIFDGGATAILYGNSMENTVFQWAKSWH